MRSSLRREKKSIKVTHILEKKSGCRCLPLITSVCCYWEESFGFLLQESVQNPPGCEGSCQMWAGDCRRGIHLPCRLPPQSDAFGPFECSDGSWREQQGAAAAFTTFTLGCTALLHPSVLCCSFALGVGCSFALTAYWQDKRQWAWTETRLRLNIRKTLGFGLVLVFTMSMVNTGAGWPESFYPWSYSKPNWTCSSWSCFEHGGWIRPSPEVPSQLQLFCDSVSAII